LSNSASTPITVAPKLFTSRATLPALPRPQTFDIDCTLSYEVEDASEFLFQIHAHDGMDQEVVSESLVITPTLTPHMFTDPNIGHRFMRLHVDKGEFELRYQARVVRTVQPVDLSAEEVPIAQVPDEFLHNLNPTRYCESDHLGRVAQKIFGALPTGYARVQAIVQWIHDNVDYQLGSTQSTTTARDVYLQRAGVCRDFAHLGITFCRALNIPARLVVGYASFVDPPPDFHAVFEAFVGGRWVMFDATMMSPIDEMVRIATGGDAKDVAFATIYGPAKMLSMNPLIRRVD
jgi:transglutaminase-like putative cysteine protease